MYAIFIEPNLLYWQGARNRKDHGYKAIVENIERLMAGSRIFTYGTDGKSA